MEILSPSLLVVVRAVDEASVLANEFEVDPESATRKLGCSIGESSVILGVQLHATDM